MVFGVVEDRAAAENQKIRALSLLTVAIRATTMIRCIFHVQLRKGLRRWDFKFFSV